MLDARRPPGNRTQLYRLKVGRTATMLVVPAFGGGEIDWRSIRGSNPVLRRDRALSYPWTNRPAAPASINLASVLCR